MTNKKSGSPSQLNCHHTASETPKRRNRKHETILHRTAKFYKKLNWKGRAFFAGSAVVIAFTAGGLVGFTYNNITAPVAELPVIEQQEVIVKETVIYAMTDAERWEVASVVEAEAGGEPYAGKLAVAQCVFQAVKDDGVRPVEAIERYSYTKNRPQPSEEAYKAVDEVFLYGRIVATEPIKYFYSPARTSSEWHESQDHVMTINNHRFFSEK